MQDTCNALENMAMQLKMGLDSTEHNYPCIVSSIYVICICMCMICMCMVCICMICICMTCMCMICICLTCICMYVVVYSVWRGAVELS